MTQRNFLFIIILTLSALLMFYACESPSDVRDNIPTNVILAIDDDSAATRDTVLRVAIHAENTDRMQVGFDSMLVAVEWEDFDTIKVLHAPHEEGLIYVFGRFATAGGGTSGVLRDSIELDFTSEIIGLNMVSESDTIYAGDFARFTMQTGEKGTAYFSITSVGLHFDFIHLGGGMFTRSIEIPSGLNYDSVLVTGYFTDEVGNVAIPKEMDRLVTIRGPRLDLTVVSEYNLSNVIGKDIWYNAGYCFVCDTHSVALVDVSDPVQPDYKRSIQSGQWSSGFDGNDRLLFIPYHSGLAVMAITEPEQADIIKTIHVNDAGRDVVISESHAYMACLLQGLKIFELHEDYIPNLVGELCIEGYGEFIDLNEEIVFVVGWTWGFAIDVSSPSEPKLLSRFDLYGEPEDIIYYNDHLFVATRHNGIIVFDVSDPCNPTQISEHSELNEVCSFALAPPFLYVGGNGNVRIMNVTDPVNFNEIARIDGLGKVLGQFVYEDYLYISQPSKLVIIKLFSQ
ncbi:hypothetical protein K9N50_01305 [bacterium]|nr:hypothetical protein [bacterium]